jgi:predicted GH43/DUF377 family glycosyl hydrolase
MVSVNKLGVLLTKTPNSFECEGELNPAVIKLGSNSHVFYKAEAKDHYSTIGYCKLSSPMEVESRNDSPILFPQSEDEFHGLGALATSEDLVHWEKKGIIVPQITYEEFKHFVESERSVHEKYIRFNKYQKATRNKTGSL